MVSARAHLFTLLMLLAAWFCVGCDDAATTSGACPTDATDSGEEAGGSSDVAAGCVGCLIGAECYPDGVTSPGNPCLVCDSATSTSAWTDNDGAVCNDGLFCTIDDSCASGTCTGTTRTCDDGVACTGTESCDDELDACVAGLVLCDGDQVCDVATGMCVAECTGCVISFLCYGDGQLNPANECQICDHESSAAAWTDNDTADCDDGLFCTIDDVCSNDVCIGTAWTCDDGVSCNGAESCDEGGDVCVAGTVQCASHEVCDVASDECVVTCTGCVIDASCYGEGQFHPETPCRICDTSSSTTAWTNNDTANCDDGFFCTIDDRCSGGSCAGDVWDCDDGVECNGVESCDETDNVCVAGTNVCGPELYLGWFMENPLANPADPTIGLFRVVLATPSDDGPFQGDMLFAYLGCDYDQKVDEGLAAGVREGDDVVGMFLGDVDDVEVEGLFRGVRSSGDGSFSGGWRLYNEDGDPETCEGSANAPVDCPVGYDYEVAGCGLWTVYPAGTGGFATTVNTAADPPTFSWSLESDSGYSVGVYQLDCLMSDEGSLGTCVTWAAHVDANGFSGSYTIAYGADSSGTVAAGTPEIVRVLPAGDVDSLVAGEEYVVAILEDFIFELNFTPDFSSELFTMPRPD